ncbi:MAG: sodium:calcium antiporter [Synechococcales bacterium]|nr:sodium:calcium antiporter [Synechococcales bacterium]
MSLPLAIFLFIAGLGLVIFFAEQLVKGLVGTSTSFGISAFLISVIFLGFDPENLAVGAAGSYERVAGIALGSVIGAAMVAVALAFGITAIFAPMRFEQVPRQIVVAPILAVLLFGILGLDGQLSRLDGGVLLLGFLAAIAYLIWLNRQGFDIEPTGEVAETLEKDEQPNRWKAVGLLILSLIAIVAGSEMLVAGAESLIARVGISDTAFGMTILAFLVSIEELARELPAALKGRADISFGNVLGSILAFFLFNAGIIALVQPVLVSDQVLQFHLPVCLATVLILSAFMLRKRISRWAGGILVALYAFFVLGSYLWTAT